MRRRATIHRVLSVAASLPRHPSSPCTARFAVRPSLHTPTTSFAPFASRMVLRDRTEQADFFFRFRSCAPFASRKVLRDGTKQADAFFPASPLRTFCVPEGFAGRGGRLAQ